MNLISCGDLSRHVCVHWVELVTELRLSRASNVFIVVWPTQVSQLAIFADRVYLFFHVLDIFRAPVPIHKSGEMRQEYEKQKMKVSY